MEVIRQPLGSNICGHCCVSMLSGESLNTAIKLIGHENPASPKELFIAFRELEIKCGNQVKQVFENSILPNKAILKVIYPRNDKSHWHWVAYNNGYIYDSSFRRGGIYLLNELSDRYLVEVKVSNYLEIFDK